MTIDLGDFVNFLYGIILELALVPGIEDSPDKTQSRKSTPPAVAAPARRASNQSTMADLLFRALSLVFTTRSSAHDNPSWRSAAFAKRLLTAALTWPPHTASRAIDFVRTLLVRDPALEALLSTEEKVASGVYRPDVPDPQLSGALNTANFWELRLLEKQHWDPRIRLEARGLMRFTR